MSNFWQDKKLEELNSEEWELLCDGCAKCCLHKLEDEDDGEVYYTDVACRQLDLNNCRCKDYSQRLKKVPGCLNLSPNQPQELAAALAWLPSTCAYRLRANGEPLPSWHHLVSGQRSSVHKAGQSVKGWAISETKVQPHQMEERIIYWVDQ